MSEKDNRKQRRNFRPREEKEFDERVVKINRVSKTVKGGRRMRFSALVVIGDKKGRVGYGMGKANEVPDAIRKATEAAKKNVIRVPLVNNYRTITHPIVGEYGAGHCHPGGHRDRGAVYPGIQHPGGAAVQGRGGGAPGRLPRRMRTAASGSMMLSSALRAVQVLPSI